MKGNAVIDTVEWMSRIFISSFIMAVMLEWIGWHFWSIIGFGFLLLWCVIAFPDVTGGKGK